MPPGRLRALVWTGGVSAAGYIAGWPIAQRLGMPLLPFHIGLFGALFVLYVAAVWMARRTRATPAALLVVLGFALVFRLAMVATPVVLSSDVYRYLWDGRVQLAGMNPYRYAPQAPELAHLRDDDIYPRINRPEARTVYPPAAQWLFALGSAVLPASIVAWRILLLLFELASLALLSYVLHRRGVPATAVIAYAWSPLVVFEGIQAGHLEVVVVALVLVGLWLRERGASASAGMVVGVATLVKLYPVLLVLAWWRRGDWRFPLAVFASVTLGYLPYAASLGKGALGFLPEYVGSREDFNLGLRGLLTWTFSVQSETGRATLILLLVAALVAALVWIGAARHRDATDVWRPTALAIMTYLLLLPTSMHPWYVLPLVAFLCDRPHPAWLYFTGAVAISYVKYVLEPAPVPEWVWAAQYVPLYLGLAATGMRSALRPRAERSLAGAT